MTGSLKALVLIAPLAVAVVFGAQNVSLPRPAPAGTAAEDVAPEIPAEERPFWDSAQAFVDAYARRDAEAIGALFTEDAEFFDEFRERTEGRAAIVQLFAEVFESAPEALIEEINIERVRHINDAVALEEGVSIATDRRGGPRYSSRYVALHVKGTDGKWRINTLKDFPREVGGRNEHLDQLEWLIGDWISEDSDSVVQTECRWSDDGNYLLRRFSLNLRGERSMDGVQRIGWDPLRRQLRSWTFDSTGGFSEGFWSRNGDQWIVTSTGVTADGESASGTAVYHIIDAERVTWEYRNLVVGNELREGVSPVTMVRRPPSPQAAAE